MVPYQKYLLSLMLLDISNQDRMDALADANCKGVTIPEMKAAFHSLASKVPPGELQDHFAANAKGESSPGYSCHKHSSSFAISQGLTNILNALQNPSNDAETQAFALVMTHKVWRVCATLFLAGEKPEEVGEAIATRFRKQYSNAVFIQAYYMFFQFGSMREREIRNWVNQHRGEDLRLLRIAMHEPSFMVRDNMGLTGNVKPEFVYNRIMTRCFVRFEELSMSGHHQAMTHARNFANTAIKSAKEYERVSSGGFNDFLSLFNIAVQQASDGIIQAHDGEEFEEELRASEEDTQSN